MRESQSTIKEAVTLEGVGLHTGERVRVQLKPAPVGHGIKFRRVDMDDQPTFDADIDNVIDTSRGTTIGVNGVRVATVEHLMAALSGMQVDNVLVEVEGSETPILDGSSRPYVEAIQSAGILDQVEPREFIRLPKGFFLKSQNRQSEMRAIPNNDFQVDVAIEYDSPVIGKQFAKMESLDRFSTDIAGARTFCFLHELEELAKRDLIKGGDLDSAIVIVDREVPKPEIHRLAQLFHKPDVDTLEVGILNNVELHFQNEPARHKLLDVVGDLALLGKPLKARIIASKPGHASNIEFAKKIKAMMRDKDFESPAPVFYDPDIPPVCDINVIKGFLPHNYPFLLVDKIIELTADSVVGVKNVTYNEWFFQGHFPKEPVFPGVLIIESMAQTGGVLAMHTISDPENYVTYFLKIDKVKFKRKVVPGDTLIIKGELMHPIRRGICEMRAEAYVGNQMVAEAYLVAQIVRKDSNQGNQNT
jgi:UDP-3-O-[3-hydroxymyristoyl] N-acetylglucosamine deacetylase/3-hydroxyacyl-[acyl-carrier-protein] dehydratase